MICKNCGAQIEDEVLNVYCKNCGHKILKNDTDGTDPEGQGEKKKGRSFKKWYFAALAGVVLLSCVIIMLVVMPGQNFRGGWPWETKVDTKAQLYGKWSDENGLLSMTFREDDTVRIGAGSGFLGADLFTFTEEGGHTLYLKANAEGMFGELLSLQVDYEMRGDEMKVSFLGMEYLLKRN
ncbi:MAG: hypothetical protein NC092_05520 [Butyrivibrio sp.]|nr:hypothetical protein [Muribaculum sp.]MCM1552134.1 hypothetical protein [Butyrivibrio sp.]